ncbi:hypothetical protein GCM10010234_12190 [Streptomyces hawaiiensis]
MDGVRAAARPGAEWGEAPGAVVERVGTDLVEVAVDGVEERVGAIEGEEGRVGEGVGDVDLLPAAGAVDAKHGYPFAVSTSLRGRIAADVGETR